ncbi:plasmid transfer ATPase TraJ [Salmonella enterica]|nr:plasmid transfer ATPase TraJ [Salmonella enterica subsp. enterica serovar Weybridge]EDW9825418.1 plasmid transfer ATPase TraJ [Salmonella enterica]EDZ3589471.1 plasmid transfer ATPase TraJ [Salmonella enterica subsp. enterica serovar Wagenia]EHL5833738.1 plasmid transfer ATPase TraJ [Salmonella enterica]
MIGTDDFGHFPFSRFDSDEFRTFFAWCARHSVSDIDLTGGSPVSVSRFGRRIQVSAAVLPSASLSTAIDDLYGRDIKPRVIGGTPVDRAIQVNGDVNNRYGLGRGEKVRLRVHIIQGTSANEEAAISVTMRVIPHKIPEISTLNIEPDLLHGMLPKSGLGLVCGETGSGKSTLLASLYRHCQDTAPDRKIVTYEDPIEYILGRACDLLPPHQAQIGRDVESYAAGLRSGMRRNPELIGIGEIRDTETANAAIQAGETGHLCLSTLHTHSVGETIPRLLGLFNPTIRDSMSWALLGVLRFIIVQVLVRTTDGRRRAVREYVVFNDKIRGELKQLPPEKWGTHIDGMLLRKSLRLADQIKKLYLEGIVAPSEAVLFLDDIKELQ